MASVLRRFCTLVYKVSNLATPGQFISAIISWGHTNYSAKLPKIRNKSLKSTTGKNTNTWRCTLPSCESVYNTYLTPVSRTWTWRFPLLSTVPPCIMEEDSHTDPRPCSSICGWLSPCTVNFTITNTSELAVAIFKYCLPLETHSALHLQSSIKHRWRGLINLLFVKCQKKKKKIRYLRYSLCAPVLCQNKAISSKTWQSQLG